MLTLTIIPLVGAGIILLAALLIFHRVTVLVRATDLQLKAEVQDKIKRARVLETRLAQDIIQGADIDPTIADFTKAIANIHAVVSETPHLWDPDDLKKAADAELAARTTVINRKARMTILALLVTVTLTVTIIESAIYSNLSAAPALLSPLPPAKSAVPLKNLPASGPVPVPSSLSPTP